MLKCSYNDFFPIKLINIRISCITSILASSQGDFLASYNRSVPQQSGTQQVWKREPIFWLTGCLQSSLVYPATSVHWRSVHPQTDHVAFQPTLFVHPKNRLLWHFTTVTFRFKVDRLSVHPKLWHSDLVNLDGLSQCDKPSHCNILSQSLWHFVCVFFVQLSVTFRPNVTKGQFFMNIRQFLFTFTCDNGSLKGLSHEISCFFHRSCDKTSTVCWAGGQDITDVQK